VGARLLARAAEQTIHIRWLPRRPRDQGRSHNSHVVPGSGPCATAWEPACWRERRNKQYTYGGCPDVLATKVAPTTAASYLWERIMRVGASLLARAAEQTIHIRRLPRRPRDQGRSHSSRVVPVGADHAQPRGSQLAGESGGKPTTTAISEPRCRGWPCRLWLQARCIRRSGKCWPPVQRWRGLRSRQLPGAPDCLHHRRRSLEYPVRH
jgi:hypothetical protein